MLAFLKFNTKFDCVSLLHVSLHLVTSSQINKSNQIGYTTLNATLKPVKIES